MLFFLIVIGVIIYGLISAGIITMLNCCREEDLPFLSEQNATLIINNAIPVGIIWPIFLLLLIVCGFIIMTKFVKNIALSK